MPYWLMKSEPDELSSADLSRLGEARWDGSIVLALPAP